ncbi:class I SAM-dependent methyltransferase [Salinarchaeum laminariae]|uniref:class I SAM-dependent methyltransferase n=1 Tax=Salinarchaeum laminariae TaxID=869888 RepID=UPI0020C09A8E|nr:methyltransferase domain-containing protein [Salinarchaeum laminariae]
MARDSADSRSSTLADVRSVYADQAATFDRFAALNRLLSGRYRRRAFDTADGEVLDVACGLATNRAYLPESVAYTGIDASPAMLDRAADRHDDLVLGEDLREMDAQDLDFPDDSFDTVISSLSTCTFPDPDAALAEMARVCKPEGRVLLLEHGRSSVGPIAKFQDWRADAHFEKHACRWTQEPLAIVRRSPLTVRNHWTALFGILTGMEAVPE